MTTVMLTVRMASWELEESRRILTVGELHRSWLDFEEVERRSPPAEAVNVVQGVATPLATWLEAEDGRHPVRIDVDGGALYWDAPEPVTGPIDVAGTVSTNGIDAPEGFPETSGVLRSIRMVWQEYVMTPMGWRPTRAAPRYEEVTSTYLPVREPRARGPEVEAELDRQAREAYGRAVAAGRLGRRESFRVVLHVPHPDVPYGTTKMEWTGALLGLDTAAGHVLHEDAARL